MAADDDDSGPARGAASIPLDDDEIVGGSVSPNAFIEPTEDDLVIDGVRGIEDVGDVTDEGLEDAVDRIPGGSDNDSITSGIGHPELLDDEATAGPSGGRPAEAPENFDTLPASNIDDTLFSAEDASDIPEAGPADDTVVAGDDGTKFIRHIERD